jgi:excisionase family DNA binding protein
MKKLNETVAKKLNEKPMNVTQAAEYIGYTRSYIYKLIYRKKIPVHRPLGPCSRVFFLPSELNAFMARNKQAADYEIDDEATAIINGEKR